MARCQLRRRSRRRQTVPGPISDGRDQRCQAPGRGGFSQPRAQAGSAGQSGRALSQPASVQHCTGPLPPSRRRPAWHRLQNVLSPRCSARPQPVPADPPAQGFKNTRHFLACSQFGRRRLGISTTLATCTNAKCTPGARDHRPGRHGGADQVPPVDGRQLPNRVSRPRFTLSPLAVTGPGWHACASGAFGGDHGRACQAHLPGNKNHLLRQSEQTMD